jgi:hypothetical protein
MGANERRSSPFSIVMTKFQAFCDGFWSAWDFTRPFSEKPRLRSLDEPLDFQWEQESEEKVSYWDVVGGYVSKAVSDYEKEMNCNVPKQ